MSNIKSEYGEIVDGGEIYPGIDSTKKKRVGAKCKLTAC